MKIVDIPTDPTPDDLAPQKIELFRTICHAGVLLRIISERDPRYNLLATMPVDRIRQLTEPERIGHEAKVVRWHGRTFHFTNDQAAVVRTLLAAYRKGTPRVHEKVLIDLHKPEADAVGQKVRLIHTFRSKKIMHPAMGYMIKVHDGWWWLSRP